MLKQMRKVAIVARDTISRPQIGCTLKSVKLVVLGIRDSVTEIDQKLCKAPLGRSVITQNIGECGVTEWLRQTLTKSLSSSIVVAEPVPD
jgi:hypothetical protein